MSQIETVARADLEYLVKLADWAAGQGFCQLPNGLEEPEEWCLRMWAGLGPENGDGYSAEALADRFIAAMPVQAEPVAWMYERGDVQHVFTMRKGNINGIPTEYFTETPLYAHPPVPQEVIAWRYARTDGFVILVEKRYTDQHPAGDGWTEQALGVIPTPPAGGSDGAL